MRDILIDLSTNNYPKSIRCGFDGEHNQTQLVVILPEDLVSSSVSYSYKFAFGTPYGEKILYPSTALLSDNKVKCILAQDVTVADCVAMQVEAYQNSNNQVNLIAKTPVVTLLIGKSVEGGLIDHTNINPETNLYEQIMESISALQEGKQDKTDDGLQTTDKTVVGAINEVVGDVNTVLLLLDSTIDIIGYSGNLINPDECVIGRIKTADGISDENANYVSTGKIPVIEGKHYTFGNNAGVRDITNIVTYDKQGNFMQATPDGHYYGYDAENGVGYIRLIRFAVLTTFQTTFMCYECPEEEFVALTGGKYNDYDGQLICEPKIKKDVDYNSNRITVLENKLIKKGDMYTTSDTLITPTISATKTLPNEVKFNDDVFSWNKDVCDYTDRLNQKTPVKLGYTVDFGFSGTELEITALSKGTRLYVVVDGVIVTDKLYYTETNTKYYAKYVLPAGQKHIQLVAYGPLFSVIVNNPNELSKVDINKPMCIFEGDSITESSSILTAGTGAMYGYPFRIGQKFDWDILDCAIGGSGYVKTGNQGQANMVDRLNTIAPYKPDIFIACAGLNDMQQDLETLKLAIDTYWGNVVNTLETKNIIVCSPFSPFTTVNETLNTIAGYCKETALKYHLPYIDLINSKTYDAMGNVMSYNDINIINAENVSDLIGDGTHLTIKGHEHMANRLSMEIWKILSNRCGLLYGES